MTELIATPERRVRAEPFGNIGADRRVVRVQVLDMGVRIAVVACRNAAAPIALGKELDAAIDTPDAAP